MAALAISTYSFGPQADIRQVVRTGQENDFGGLELGSFTYWPDALSREDMAFMRQSVTGAGWPLSIHFIHRGVSLGNHERENRLTLIHQLQETVRLCDRLGGHVVVVHPGNLTHPPAPDMDAVRGEAYELVVDSLAQCAPVAEKHGVYICVENTYLRDNEILRSYHEYAGLIETLGSSFVKLTLDLGHAHVSAGIPSAIQEMGDSTHHIHLHDNHGDNDKHLEVGKGTIDFGAYKEYLTDFPGMIALESRDTQDPQGAVTRSRKVLGTGLGL